MTSNLKSRDLHGTEEHFFYDTDGKQLNRLAGTGPDEYTVSETYAFADNGNITEKQGVGDYVYHPDKKNAVTQIDIPELGQNQDLVQFVSYNHFNSVSEIKNLDDQLRVNLEYGSDDQRRVAKYWDESGAQDELIKTRLYAGAYEKQTNADLTEIEVHYISAGGQLAAMYVVENGVGSYYYPHQDHLGSIIHITDANGDIVYTQSFDAWGRTRNPNDLTYDNIPERPDWLWRGYTGHEHLDEFGLINMNGRLYDPVVGRMLSPDNFVSKPDWTQSYNRYSYVWNNPLKFSDPSGEEPITFIAIGIGVLVGAYIGGSTAEGDFNPGNWAWDRNTFAGMGIGAVIGGVAGYGFSVAAPIVAGTGFFSAFGTSGTVAAYSLTGAVAGGPWNDDRVVGATVAVGNATDTTDVFDWTFKLPKSYTTSILDVAEVRINLDSLVWTKWVAGGKLGSKVKIVNSSRYQIMIEGDSARLDNVSFGPHERGLMNLSFNFRTRDFGGVYDYDYHVIQQDAHTHYPLGGEKFEIHVEDRELFLAEGGDDKEIYLNHHVELTAEEINEDAIYNWYDPEGNLIHTGKDFTVTPQITTKYRLEVIAETDGFKDYDEVEVVVKTAEITSVSPNPVSSLLTVEYDTQNVQSAYLVLTKVAQSGISNNYILNVELDQITIDVSSLPFGMYNLILVADGNPIDQNSLLIE